MTRARESAIFETILVKVEMMEEEMSSKNNSMVNKSRAKIDGMVIIPGDPKNIRGKIEAQDSYYQTQDGKKRRIRMMFPEQKNKKKKYPLVFHIQGSAWMKQNLNNHLLDLKEVVTNGYIVAIIEYTPIPEGIFPKQVEDCKQAIRFLMTKAEEYSIDTTNLFLSGDSSGGHTALLCWATWNQPLLDSSTTPLPPIRGCIDLYGVSDLTTIADYPSSVDHTHIESPESQLLGGKIPKDHKEEAEKASVPYYLKKNKQLAPLLIMHGNLDTVVPFEQSVELFAHCQSYEVTAEFYAIDNADHGGSLFFCEAVLKNIVSFLKKYTQ